MRGRVPTGIGLAIAIAIAIAACADLGGLTGDDEPPTPPPVEAGNDQSATAPDSATAEDAGCIPGPRDPNVLDDAVAVAAGVWMACALRENGTVVCWGSADVSWRFPDGSSQAAKPIAIPGLGTVKKLALGGQTACTVDDKSLVHCFGKDANGSLGGPTVDAGGGLLVSTVRDTSQTPITTAIDVASGFSHVCAILQGGSVACWGDNSYRQLGRDDVDAGSSRAIPIAALNGGSVAISAGASHSCVLRKTPDARVECWGSGAAGQFIAGYDAGPTSAPITFDAGGAGSGEPAFVGAGDSNTCIVDVAGKVYCAGTNPTGNLGSLNVGGSISPPTLVQDLAAGKTVATSSHGTHACALRDDGTLVCFGRNHHGQLGRGTKDLPGAEVPHPIPEPVLLAQGQPLTDVISFTTGSLFLSPFSCAIVRRKCASSGTVYCWGDSDQRQLGAANVVGDAVYAVPVQAP